METGALMTEVAWLFYRRMAEGQALWQNDVRGVLPSMPVAVTDDRHVPLSGGNALLLAQVMWDAGWRDPRFLTAEQVALSGGVVLPEAAPVEIQFVRAVGADGSLLEVPEAVTYAVFNAEQVSGLPAWEAPQRDWTLETLAARLLPKFEVNIVHDQVEGAFFSVEDGNVHMPPMESFASVADYVGVALHELSHASRTELGREVSGEVGQLSFAREELRAEMASMQLSVALGVPHDVVRHEGFVPGWMDLLRADPGEFFRAARDAEKMAALVLWHVKSVERELAAERVLGMDVSDAEVAQDAVPEQKVAVQDVDREKVSERPVGDVRGRSRKAEYQIWLEQQFEVRQAILSVPYREKDAALAAGAVFYPPQKLWFVPESVELAPFKKWLAKDGQGVVSQMLSRGAMVEDFRLAMQSLGLSVDDEIKDDGKWHYVSLPDHKEGKNKSGAYVLNLDGGRDGRPSGMIMNKLNGEQFHWKYEGAELSQEQLARMRADALDREARAARELKARHESVAGQAIEVWAHSAPDPQGSHGYLSLKGVGAHGTRLLMGAALLEYPAFKGESGGSVIRPNEIYALIPLRDEAGKIWSLQAISEDGKTKAFMTGGRKKGLFYLINDQAMGTANLPESGPLAFAEGFATGASLHESSGWPVLVCFDAGNLEHVARDVGRGLPDAVTRIIAADNDQFFMERAFGSLARMGVVAVGEGAVVQVSAGPGVVRDVALGEVVADGSWQQVGGGRYRVTLEDDAGAPGCVGKVSVEIVRTEGAADKKETLRAGNRGMEAAAVAVAAVPGTLVVSPQFSSLQGRPTDWNDLAVREGAGAVVAQLEALVGRELLGKGREGVGDFRKEYEEVRSAGRGR